MTEADQIYDEYKSKKSRLPRWSPDDDGARHYAALGQLVLEALTDTRLNSLKAEKGYAPPIDDVLFMLVQNMDSVQPLRMVFEATKDAAKICYDH